jgi:hypothetical protein
MLERSRVRRLAGWVWLAGWVCVLYLVVSPWSDLGGIVDERLRWFHRFSLWMGIGAGIVAGLHGREGGAERWYKRVWYPLACCTAVMMIVLAVSGGRLGEIGIVLTGFLAVWSGLDFGYWIYPMLHDRQDRDHRCKVAGRCPDG